MIKIDPLKEGGGTAEEKEERKRGEGRERGKGEKGGEKKWRAEGGRDRGEREKRNRE